MKKLLTTSALVSTIVFVSNAAMAAVIEGRVSDQSGDIALDGAIVRIVETGATTTTNRAGEYRFAAVPAGAYTLRISYVGAEQVETSVNVASADAVARADVSLGSDVRLIDNVLVVGQRGALNSALSQQKASDRVITVLSSDAIGQLPDENVAEAARRAAGVNIQNDQGEGRFVSIRGANPNFVTSTINGVRIPSPEADARQVPLDVIDSDILSSITITKTLTPDVDGDSIGGNVEITTLSGLDQKNMLLKLKGAGIYANQVDQFSQRLSGVFANNFMDNRLGVAASVAWQERKFGSENKEVDGPDWELGEVIPYPEELEFRDYQITRERLSASLNLDFQATEDVLLYAHGLYSDFSDQEFRSRVENKFGDPDFAGATGSVATFDAAADDPFEVDRDIKDRLEEQTIWSIVTGAKLERGPVTADVSGSYSFADEREPERLDTDFRAQFDEGIFGVDVSDQILPRLAFPDAAAEADYFNSDNYEFDGLERTNGVTEDEEWAFAANFRYDLDLFGAPGYVKTGGKIRLREKFYDLELQVYDGFDGDDLLLSQFTSDVDFDLDRINPVPNGGLVRDFFFANEALFELNDFDSAVSSNVEDYTANEDVFAGYAMFQRQFSSVVSLIAGVRVEHTEYDAEGQSVLVQEFEGEFDGDVTATDPFTLIPAAGIPGQVLADDLEFEFDAGDNVTTLEYEAAFLSPESFSNSYTDVLPSASLRFDFTDEVVGRLGYYKSIVRPNIEAAAPRINAEQGEDSLVAEAGNPLIDRQRAHNIDASLEYYPNNKAVYSVGFFYKDISDFIARQQFSGADAVFNGVQYDELDLFVNLPDASLYGFEVNMQQPLDMLPGLLDGLILSANYTFVDGEATLGDGRDIDLPGQSQHVATGILGYEKGPINIRFAATYRDEFLDEISVASDVDGSALDRIVDDHIQLDVSAKYRITDQFRAFVEFKNINNEPFVASIRSSQFGSLNAQFEEYGWTAKFGLAFTY
ncbi:MAG: TonB-dependent receptor [Pseudomonadota bacterium]